MAAAPHCSQLRCLSPSLLALILACRFSQAMLASCGGGTRMSQACLQLSAVKHKISL